MKLLLPITFDSAGLFEIGEKLAFSMGNRVPARNVAASPWAACNVTCCSVLTDDSFKDKAKELIFSDTCIRTEQNDSKYRENKIITMFGVYVTWNRLSWHQFHNYGQDGAMT